MADEKPDDVVITDKAGLHRIVVKGPKEGFLSLLSDAESYQQLHGVGYVSIPMLTSGEDPTERFPGLRHYFLRSPLSWLSSISPKYRILHTLWGESKLEIEMSESATASDMVQLLAALSELNKMTAGVPITLDDVDFSKPELPQADQVGGRLQQWD